MKTSGTVTPAADGTFTLTAAQAQDADGDLVDIFADFTMPIVNGVSIIKDLMKNYDGKTFISSFWDTAETTAAETYCRNTSIYIDDDAALSKCIESICFDCDLRFFTHDNGLYTVRLYDAARTPVMTIRTDDYLTAPEIQNSGSEYLTSCIIKYRKSLDNDKYRTYEETSYAAAAYAIYKKYKSKTFETGLYELTAAQEKATTLMDYQANVRDIITRVLPWDYATIEITDFVTASPLTRVGETDTMETYEVLGVEKNLDSVNVKITLRKV